MTKNVHVEAAAEMLCDLKVIATKEVQNLPLHSVGSLFETTTSTTIESLASGEDTTANHQSSLMMIVRRGRSISMESVDLACGRAHKVTPILSFTPSQSGLLDDEDQDNNDQKTHSASFLLDGGSLMEHHDWSSSSGHRASVVSPLRPPKALKQGLMTLTDDLTTVSPRGGTTLSSLQVTSPAEVLKQCKRKRETFVGLTTQSGIPVRSTLRKKFSWKQYPELEDYLLRNQDEYFEFSSKNYTAEQRKYNNGLTWGLLALAAEEGYVFEEFTFPMLRDRIRCYYKSHSQSAKAKKQRKQR